MRILGVNGILTPSFIQESFTDKLLDRLKGRHEVVDVSYPMIGVLGTYVDFAKDFVARRILAANKVGDCLIAHSFGGLVSRRAMQMGARFRTVIFFAVAAECTIDFPPDSFDRLYNIYSRDDLALRLGKRLPHHEFGGLGLDGYEGEDSRVTNIPMHGTSHGGYVSPNSIGLWVDRINVWLA